MARVSKTGTIGGQTITGANTRAIDPAADIGEPVTVAAGKAGTLSTRTDANTGILTLLTGHGIQTGDVVDVYWVDLTSANRGLRRGMTVGTVSVNSVPIDLGAGDDLPAQTTAIVVCKQRVLNVDVDKDEIVLAMAGMTRRGSVEFQENDGTPIKSLHLGHRDALAASSPSAELWDWTDGIGDTNPFGADIGKVAISNGSSAGTNVCKFGLHVANES